jgi:hypothetical protein
MAWTTPKTWTPLEKITAADMNKQISGNAQHLYDNKLNNAITQSLPTRAVATPYTFTAGKLLHVVVTMLNTANMVCDVTVDGVVILRAGRDDAVAAYVPMAFMVAYGGVYQVDIASGSGSVYKWVETVIGA